MFTGCLSTFVEEDGPKCSAGKFNKLAEIMKCVDPGRYNFPFITKKGASSKLPCVVNKKAISYLRDNPEKIAAVLNNDVSEIYSEIRNKIYDCIHKEFGSAFENDDAAFSLLIDAGEYAKLTDKTKEVLMKMQNKISYNALDLDSEQLDSGEIVYENSGESIV
jgi:hypothetical protein